jgi:putative Holliday junction resolvase
VIDIVVRTGVRLGIDVGGVRIGVARSDRDGLLATPVETIPAGAESVPRIAAIAAEVEAVEIVVGLPLSLSGAEGPAARLARAFAVELASHLEKIPVRLVDERLTTVSATRGLQAAGVSSRAGRAVVDQAAAVIILQGALDAERGTGRPVGEIVGDARPKPGESSDVGAQ